MGSDIVLKSCGATVGSFFCSTSTHGALVDGGGV